MERKLEKNIFKLSLPIFIELLFYMLLGTVDTIMLNEYSDYAVSAVVNATSISNLFTVCLSVIATGIVVVLTRTLGAKDHESEAKIVGSGLIFNSVLGVVIATILCITSPFLLTIMKADSTIIEYSESYLRIISFGIIAMAISNACSAIFRSYGKPLVIMKIVIVSNIINIVVNYTLIFGNFGLPELGVIGAAVGTLVSNVFSVICALVCLFKILGYSPRTIIFSLEHLKEILRIGIPSALENFLYNLSQFIVMISVNLVLIGGEFGLAATARAYVQIILNFVMLFSIAISSGNQIVVGYYIGEMKFKEAKEFTFRNFKTILCAVFIVLFIVNIFWRQLIGLLTDDINIINALNGVFIVAILLEVGRACNLLFIAALRTTGDIIFPVIMGVISMFTLSALGSYILGVHLGFGIIGLFIAQALDESFRGLFMLLRWKNKNFDLLYNI